MAGNTGMPVVAGWLLQVLMRERDRHEVTAEVAAEYGTRLSRDGQVRSRLWLWRQVLGSVPGALGGVWLRGTTGFETGADRMSGNGRGLESWIVDVRFALRNLRSRPQYVLLSVLTLALGIGGTTAVFGIARVLLLDPLPYGASDELVMFWNPFDWSEAEVSYLRPSWDGFEGVAAYRPEGVFMARAGAAAQLVPGIATSAELFEVLGTRPLLGRGFEPGDDEAGANPKAVLSHGFWQELGGNPAIVGSTIEMDGLMRQVVGVMPPGFWFPDPTVRVWVTTLMRPDNRSGNYALIGRMESGRGIAAMADPLRRVTTRLGEQFTYSPQWDKTQNADVTPLSDHLLGPVRPALLATLAGMGVILLMACVNVATLMLGQLRGRSSEFAVRVAMGAGGRRIAQQLLVESIVVGILAGIAGAVVARAGFELLLAVLPLGELASAVTADWRLFGTALGFAFGAALLIAAAPVYSLWRGDLRDALSHGRTAGIDARGGRLEDSLVVVEVALAVLVAASAAVLIRSVGNLGAIDPGVETQGVAVVDVTAPGGLTLEQRRQDVVRLVEALGAMPGVTQAGAVQRLPLRRTGDNWGIQIQTKPELESSTTALRVVTRGYFDALGIELRSGRMFEETDRTGSDPVMVIDEALAATYFPGEDPIGQYIDSSTGQGWMRVVGIVENVAHAGLTAERAPSRYVLYDQFDYVPESSSLVLRVERGRDPAAVLQQAVRTINETSDDVAVSELSTMATVHALAMGPTRRTMQLMTLLGMLALALGAIGVYGVVSHFVNRRRRDWVIRMALGMKPSAAVLQVVGRGTRLVGVGCAIGLLTALAATRLLESLLYEVDAADPLALLGAAVTLIVAGCLAALVPGLRASRANPAQVLRDAA